MAGEAGHTFLAKLGKKRLRPGGKKATDWLIEQGGFTPDKQVLEIACNMGTTTVELAQRFGCQISAVDLDETALAVAREAASKNGVAGLISLTKANAMKLPFDDESFDIVINEAMLTMQTKEGKRKCLQEYFRVLKPGGLLLTHDVMLKETDPQLIRELSQAIHVHAQPLTAAGWKDLFAEQDYTEVRLLSGDMTLLNFRGMIYDEGILGTLSIMKNALKRENRGQFSKMFKMFKANQDRLGFIACACKKPG